MKRALKLAVGILAAAGMVACGGAANEEAGAMKLNIASSSSALLADVTMTMVIKGPNSSHIYDTWTGTLPYTTPDKPCPVGHYTYTITTTTSGDAKFEGASGEFDVVAGEMTRVEVLLQQTLGSKVPMVVVAPYTSRLLISGLGLNGKAAWGRMLTLEALVSHPDNDRPDMDYFHYKWSHSCSTPETQPGSFIFPADQLVWEGEPSWLAHVKVAFLSYCQGVETITLETVNDNKLFCWDTGNCSVTSTVSFIIPYDPQGIAPNIAVNFAPIVSCSSIANAEPCPGGVVALNATASDPDGVAGDSMTYSWVASCVPGSDNGSFADASALSTTWTAPAGNEVQCDLTLTVTDKLLGKNTGTVTVKTAPAAASCPLL